MREHFGCVSDSNCHCIRPSVNPGEWPPHACVCASPCLQITAVFSTAGGKELLNPKDSPHSTCRFLPSSRPPPVPVPNAANDVGSNREKWIVNTSTQRRRFCFFFTPGWVCRVCRAAKWLPGCFFIIFSSGNQTILHSFHSAILHFLSAQEVVRVSGA